MNFNKLRKDENIIYETQVKYGKYNSNVYLTLTNQRLIFLKEKGIFRKKLKVTDEIIIENIKMYKDKAQIKQKLSTLYIKTFNKNVNITCKNIFEAKKILEEIIKLRTGNDILDRANNKLNSARETLKKVSGILGIIVLIPAGIKKLDENKEVILDFIKNTIKR